MKCEVCGGAFLGDGFDHKPGCFMAPSQRPASDAESEPGDDLDGAT